MGKQYIYEVDLLLLLFGGGLEGLPERKSFGGVAEAPYPLIFPTSL